MPPSSAYTFSLRPELLDLRIAEFEVRAELMRAVGAAAALR
jgi:hypothetical protein